MKALIYIFTNSLIAYIITHTNEYGEDRCKCWGNIYCSHPVDFICITFSFLFKREDINPLIVSLTINYWITQWQKKLNNLHRIILYINVCSIINKPSLNYYNWSPTYNIRDFWYYLKNISNKLFIPGDNLSLGETLIHDFVRIKFKVIFIPVFYIYYSF